MSGPRQALWLHGAGAGARDTPFLSIASVLGPEVEIVAPQLGDPDPQVWGDAVAEALDTLPETALLLGHSLGGSVLLQVLAGRRRGRRAPAVFLFAAPFWGAPGWDAEGFALPGDAAAGLAGATELFLYHGAADEVVDPSHSALYQRSFPAASCRVVPGADHLFAGAVLSGFAADLAQVQGSA